MRAQEAPAASVRGVLAVGEFRALLSASALSTLGDQVTRIAVAVLVFERTDSSFLAAATVACSFLTWLVAGPFLSALADRWPRKRLMLSCDVARAVLVLCLTVPGLPLVVIFLVLVLVGALAPPFEAARAATLPDVLQGDAFTTGNSLQGAVRQGATVSGFLVGGLLVSLLTPEGALVLDAASFLVSAVLIGAGVRARAALVPSGTGLARETWEGFRLVARSPRLRTLLAYGCLGSVPMIAPEGLAVPVADALGGGGFTAGALTASLPAGFIVGSVLVLRVPAHRREELLWPLTALSCLPLVLSPFCQAPVLLAATWALAGTFTAAQLIANAAYVTATPPEARGRAFGVAASMIMATQGVVLLVVGALAEHVDPRTAVALAAAGTLVLLLPLRALSQRRPRTIDLDEPRVPQAPADLCRSTPG